MRWHAGNAQVCVRFERGMVEQHCAAHLGHALDEPLEFEPELRLDTPAGRYFLRLVQLFAEELTAARCLDGRWPAGRDRGIRWRTSASPSIFPRPCSMR